MQPYTDHGPVKCDLDFDTSHVKGKTVIVTGGSSGMGEAYVKHLTRAGAFVVFGDVNEKGGERVASETGQAARYVRCDVTQWQDQLSMFKHAIKNSPKHRIDIVIANAGVSGFDDVFHNNLDLEDPEEPQLGIIKVNGIGVLYTTKLALHYFRRQFKLDPQSSEDQLLIMQGSLAGYLDLRGATQYSFAKYGMRSIMRCLRRSETVHNIRVNYIAPNFVKTGLLSQAVIENLERSGTAWATVDDAAGAVMKLCSDPSINGRALAVMPRTWFETGYVDIDADDYREGPLKLWTDFSIGSRHRELSQEQQKVN